MDKNQLLERIARLEFQNDQLLTEIDYLDRLLRSVGFSEGIASVKKAACEIIDYERLQEKRFEEGLPDTPPGLDW